jgi:reactive intermediate/imine deaminase
MEKSADGSSSPSSTLPLSKCRRAGNLLFVSGQLPRDESGALVGGSIERQTRQALQNLIRILKSEGCAPCDVVKVTAWITDAQHLTGFNEAYGSIFAPPFPARSVVVSGLAVPADVEIEAIALIA